VRSQKPLHRPEETLFSSCPPRGQGFHSTPEGLLVDALAAGGARRICTCCSRRTLQKVFRTSVSKLGLYLNDESKIVFIMIPSLVS
jgi:hypothetical protein